MTHLELFPVRDSANVELYRTNDLPAHDPKQDPHDLAKDGGLAHDSRGIVPLNHDEDGED